VTATTPADIQRAAGLRRMKLIALSLLLAAGVVYVIARINEDNGAAWGYIRAFSEAAMVGALADWFAVTALFRHPLGIPIPHTAIIPTRKDSLGRSLGEFVETNFMAKEILEERVSNAHVGDRLGAWLSHPENAERAAVAISDVIHGAVEVIDDTEVEDAIRRMVESRIRSTPVAPLLGKAIDLAVEGGHHERLLDAIFAGLQGFLADNREAFRERLERESPWWVPEAIDNRIFAKIYDSVGRFLIDLRNDPHHEVRVSIEQRVIAFADRLRHDPELLAKGDELKEELLAHPDMQAWMTSLWSDAKRSLMAATSRTDSELHRRIASSLQRLGERLHGEPELQAKVDHWVAQAVGYVIDNYRNEVSSLIESTIARWDGEQTSRKIELQVGRDLQFIRINGTVVGGLAGLLIYTITEVFVK
jgi:uncharacterized membrane-anchored protein YjiN (DUF445 family)